MSCDSDTTLNWQDCSSSESTKCCSKNNSDCTESRNSCRSRDSCRSEKCSDDTCSCDDNSECEYINTRWKTRVRQVTTNNTCFSVLITPVAELYSPGNPGDPGSPGCVPIQMTRTNGVIVLQWNAFQGYIIASGQRHLVVAQSIPYLPATEHSWVVNCKLRGEERIGKVIIDPYAKYGKGHLFFVLPVDVVNNDGFEFDGSSISWIMRQ